MKPLFNEAREYEGLLYVIFKPGRSSITPTVNICINNTVVNQEVSTVFLGVIIDEKLSWNVHIQKIRTKISKNIGLLCKARKVLQRKTLVSLYYSFIYPYISYCIEIWGKAAKKYTDCIFKLQKLCVRIINGAKKMAPSIPLFTSLEILPLPKIYEYCVVLLMFKYYHGLLPTVITNIFQTVSVTNDRAMRHHSNLILPRCTSQFAYNSLKLQGPKLWNYYNEKISIMCTYYTFKYNFKNLLLKL